MLSVEDSLVIQNNYNGIKAQHVNIITTTLTRCK